jgi:hypothetical protein
MPSKLTEYERVTLERFEEQGGLFHQMPVEAQRLWKDLYPGERYILANGLIDDLTRIGDQGFLTAEERAGLRLEIVERLLRSVKSFLSEHVDDVKWEAWVKAEAEAEGAKEHNPRGLGKY